MMKNYIIIIYLIFFISSTIVNTNLEISPKELIHGVTQGEIWEIGQYYEYYIDISKYVLNEENIFEIYGLNTDIDSNDLEIYLLSTNISDDELIKNETIKPDTKDPKYKYQITSQNIKRDTLNIKNYFFLPYKKTDSSQNFLIILIKNRLFRIQTLFYISRRILSLDVEQKNPNIVEIYSALIEARNDIRLYYKINLEKVNLIKNNVYLLIDDEKSGDNEKDLEVVFYFNFSSLEKYDHNLLILEKNTKNISEVFLGIKSQKNEDDDEYDILKQFYIKMQIRIDEKEFIYIEKSERTNTKIFIERMNCEKELFVIENYNTIYDKRDKFIISDKLYGNYSLKYYGALRNLNFEDYDENQGLELEEYIVYLKYISSIYKFKCITPSAFYLEIFTELDTPENLPLGHSIKTYLPYNYSQSNGINLQFLNELTKYKVQFHILDYIPEINRTLIINIQTQGQSQSISITEPQYYENKIFYYYKYQQNFKFSTQYQMLLEYFFTSNNLFINIVEGRTRIGKYESNVALKIRKDIPFDYISLGATCRDVIYGFYELKLINIIDLEEETNKLMVGLPQINLPDSFSVNLKFSNPYDKYDQTLDISNDKNSFYLILQFNILQNPVFLNIEYIYNENIVSIPPSKPEIIIPQKEYEIKFNSNDYQIKDKILFNINKCNNLANYTLINYYENNNNIIKETKLLDSHQIIEFNNIYKRSKLILNKDEGEEETKNQSILFPAAYYNKGDIKLNYFSIESSILKELKFTSDLDITYENESWSNIILSWKEYVYRESNNKKINIATNYSIYILPKKSVVNTICQMFLIPSNKTIINSTQVNIELNEGEYKVAIIASVIDEEMPFENMYNIIELTVIKRINITLIVILSVLGLIVILLILIFIFRKKIALIFKRKKLSKNINSLNINNSLSEYDELEENSELGINERRKATEELIKMMNEKKMTN